MLRFISELERQQSNQLSITKIQRRIDRDYDFLRSCDLPGSIPILRIWNNPDCLVVGKQVRRWTGYEEARSKCERQGWTVFERATGGTIVPHYSGVLNVSYISPNIGPRKSFDEAYDHFCSPIVRALSSLGVAANVGAIPGSYCDGDSNITVSERKIVGTAQRWKRSKSRHDLHHVLVHGSLNLFDAPKGVAAVNTFLKSIKDQKSPHTISADAHTDLATEIEVSHSATNMNKSDQLDRLISQLRYEFERDASAFLQRTNA